MSKIKKLILANLTELNEDAYSVCGIVDRKGSIYPLGADTKVLSTIFELITRPIIFRVAKELKYQVRESEKQNHYPDFTLLKDEKDRRKIAIDVKTTYRKSKGAFWYTLGGYTSFIRDGKEKKNIVFPFNEYLEHWVIGFVYDRVAEKKSAVEGGFSIKDLKQIAVPFRNVEVFIQEKWRISSDRAGSGNTTNIGSITGTLNDFQQGRGVFKNEEEFLKYWRGYGRTKKEREKTYSTIEGFRKLKK
jgi:hypothetical protein